MLKALARTTHPAQFSNLELWTLTLGVAKPNQELAWNASAEVITG